MTAKAAWQAMSDREDIKAKLRAEWTLGTDWAEVALRHIEAARAEERERYRDWQTETRALVLLEAVNAMRARETAELVMRDLARLNGDNDTAQLHSDRAQAFREAYGAFPNLESLQIRAGSPAPAAPRSAEEASLMPRAAEIVFAGFKARGTYGSNPLKGMAEHAAQILDSHHLLAQRADPPACAAPDMIRDALVLARDTLISSRIFVTSKERIKFPEGENLYDEAIETVVGALASTPQHAPAPAAPVVWTELLVAVRYMMPYLIWTMGPESPGHHPTMPSAVARLRAALEAASREGG